MMSGENGSSGGAKIKITNLSSSKVVYILARLTRYVEYVVRGIDLLGLTFWSRNVLLFGTCANADLPQLILVDACSTVVSD